jgi:hypothetical protein
MMSSTGFEHCPVCHDQGDQCAQCGGRALAPLSGTATVRGGRWAEQVVQQLAARWPMRWPQSGRAIAIAARWVQDLAPRDDGLRVQLVRICMGAAARRYGELTDFLMRKRLRLPEERPPIVVISDEDDTFPR